MANKEEWIRKMKKANPHMTCTDLQFSWEREKFRLDAEDWADNGIIYNYIPYVSKANRLRLCEELCLSLSESDEEFWGTYERLKRLRDVSGQKSK